MLATLAFSLLAPAFATAPQIGGPPPLTLQFNQAAYQAHEPMHVQITGIPGARFALLYDFEPGPTNLPFFGPVQVGPNFIALDSGGVIPPNGTFEIDCVAPCLPDGTIYLQTIAIDFIAFTTHVSNPVTLNFTDPLGVCSEPPCVVNGSNTSNFNGTTIPAGSTIWFNAVVDLRNMRDGDYAALNDVTIEFTAGGVPTTIHLPDSFITTSSSISQAETVYLPGLDQWCTLVPIQYDGNIFLSGIPYPVTTDLEGGISPVTWSAEFSSSHGKVSFQWKWAAAVYTQFTTDLNAIGVKPIDGSTLNPYANSHHAGTPENFTDFVTGGARGGGGSNFTGSYSGTERVECP